MAYLGRDIDRDPQRARSYFEAAAQQGYPPARINLFQLDTETRRLTPEQLEHLVNRPLPSPQHAR